MYAIDSLRQLAIKYLERAELANFTFQNDILKPFVVIMRNSKNSTIRALIVDCIVQVIRALVFNLLLVVCLSKFFSYFLCQLLFLKF